MAAAELLRYWHTLRYLKPTQTLGRVHFRLSRPRVDARSAPQVRVPRGLWTHAAQRRPSLQGPDEFRFLNEVHALGDVGWDAPEIAKLWRYNLHYFEDLVAPAAADRRAWHEALIARWLRENPPARGTGWEPYPASLRIVNWIKWALQGGVLTPEAVHSLAVQTRWLEKRLEWHLQGNHLFVNAKALVFAGLFFAGPEAERWLKRGFGILRKQVPEQILADGGQFERSPMYHALAVEDMLDLWNVCNAAGDALAPDHAAWMHAQRDVIERMRHWLLAMTHPDGEIALFNDAAFGIAPRPAELEAYAQRLGFAPLAALGNGVVHLRESGYIRVQKNGMVALLDVGPIGPDYLPGHAHADTLSFELSVHGQRVLVDSGTSVYGLGPERLRQRSTAAHNTLSVDGEDSSEVWSGFRVARRARPFDLQLSEQADTTTVACSHDGYLRLGGGAIHRRTFRVGQDFFEVHDEVSGTGQLCARWHFAPGLEISGTNPALIRLLGGQTMNITARQATWSVERSTWHCEFGKSEPSWVGVTVPGGRTSVVRFSWS